MGWRIIEINKNCFVKLFLNNLIITGDTNISIPINDIDVLLFSNNRINVSINLLNELASQNICVFFCDEKYLPNSMLFPIFGNLKTLSIFDKQLNWSNDYKGLVWQKIVYLKCNNQFEYLKYLKLLNDSQEIEIQNYINQIQPFDSTNREGHIAKIYWHTLFGVGFNRQDDNIQINKLLNYGYTILNGMVARSIIKKGLDTRISLFHKSVYNQFALSSDLIEPFRNVVDILVIELYKREIISKNNAPLSIDIKEICLDFIANFKLMINGYYQQLNNAIDEFVDCLVNESFDNLTIEYSFEVDTNAEFDYFKDQDNIDLD